MILMIRACEAAVSIQRFLTQEPGQIASDRVVALAKERVTVLH